MKRIQREGVASVSAPLLQHRCPRDLHGAAQPQPPLEYVQCYD